MRKGILHFELCMEYLGRSWGALGHPEEGLGGGLTEEWAVDLQRSLVSGILSEFILRMNWMNA